MSRLAQLDRAFKDTSEAFPLPDYLSDDCYFQLKAIIGALERIGIPERPKLLDVGSGPMDKVAVLQRLGFQCSAVDDLNDPWHLLGDNRKKIIEFGRQAGINFHLQQDGDFTIPFEAESFDIVTSIAVIEHLHDSPRHILNAMGRQLKPGGLLVVVMPNAVNLRKRLSVLIGRTNYNPLGELYYSIGPYRGHVREYTLAETREICTLNGFHVIHSSTFDHLGHSLPPVARQLYRMAGLFMPTLLTGLLVVARKPDGWAPKSEDRRAYFTAIAGATPAKLETAE